MKQATAEKLFIGVTIIWVLAEILFLFLPFLGRLSIVGSESAETLLKQITELDLPIDSITTIRIIIDTSLVTLLVLYASKRSSIMTFAIITAITVIGVIGLILFMGEVVVWMNFKPTAVIEPYIPLSVIMVTIYSVLWYPFGTMTMFPTRSPIQFGSIIVLSYTLLRVLVPLALFGLIGIFHRYMKKRREQRPVRPLLSE